MVTEMERKSKEHYGVFLPSFTNTVDNGRTAFFWIEN